MAEKVGKSPDLYSSLFLFVLVYDYALYLYPALYQTRHAMPPPCQLLAMPNGKHEHHPLNGTLINSWVRAVSGAFAFYGASPAVEVTTEGMSSQLGNLRR